MVAILHNCNAFPSNALYEFFLPNWKYLKNFNYCNLICCHLAWLALCMYFLSIYACKPVYVKNTYILSCPISPLPLFDSASSRRHWNIFAVKVERMCIIWGILFKRFSFALTLYTQRSSVLHLSLWFTLDFRFTTKNHHYSSMLRYLLFYFRFAIGFTPMARLTTVNCAAVWEQF